MRDDLQLAQASRVADDVDPGDLVPREGEDEHPGQSAEGRDNDSDGSIDQRQLDNLRVCREAQTQ